jgi:2-C-methyl-D-erythritol 4-phosphate cytidylyltransferase/2-C-methyl-D-erythritol 2,4-cyclodiphosphate synthase
MADGHSPVVAVLVAGGSGLRASGGAGAAAAPKQYLQLAGRPVLAWSARALLADPRVGALVVVHGAGQGEAAKEACAGLGAGRPVVFTQGGASRTASVRAGLDVALAQAQALEQAQAREPSVILIHDAARPGLAQPVLDRLIAALEAGADGAVPVLPGADALWRSEGGELTAGVDRTGLVRVQTPQAFRAPVLARAYGALAPGAAADDDAAVVRAAGGRVVVVEGSVRLDKITWPGDHARMEQILVPATAPMVPALIPATGTGYDAHRLGPGDHVTLCGVRIAHSGGLVGHSDADVAWHALCDAIYGALAEGDIGKAFPPSDPQWKGAPSRVFLEHAAGRVLARGGRLAHVDITLVCEAPRVGPHREAMRAATAQVLGIPVARVSVKATTTEKMGFTGRGEGIAALASATVLLPD